MRPIHSGNALILIFANLTRNPWLMLQSVSFERLKGLAKEVEFIKLLSEHLKVESGNFGKTSWFSEVHPASIVNCSLLQHGVRLERSPADLFWRARNPGRRSS